MLDRFQYAFRRMLIQIGYGLVMMVFLYAFIFVLDHIAVL